MRTWGVTDAPGRLHTSQSICDGCGLIFSNPVCEWPELEAFYRDDFWEIHWPTALNRDQESVEATVSRQRHEVTKLTEYRASGALLEIGSGTGGFLAAAREAGFGVWGIETSAAAVKHTREVFGIENVLHGYVPDDRLPVESFDVVYAWHVIEHVVDLDEFVDSLRSLLKPGGLLWIGTETHRNASHYLERASYKLRRKPAPFATANEHTLLFTTKTLRDVLERRGFEVMLSEAYQPSYAEKRPGMRFRTPFSWLYFALQHAANNLGRTGPLIRVVARKR